jgi:tetratricopeptide (TPR) repeat protein
MGNALQEQGKLEEAIDAYTKALSIKPDYAEVYYNMGNALQEQGKPEEAIEAYNKALSIKPDYAKVYYNMGFALKGLILSSPSRDLQKKITLMLEQKSLVTPRSIITAAISLLKFEPSLQIQLQFVDGDEARQNILEIISGLSELSLLMRLMDVCPLPDLELEGLLKKLRHAILFYMSSIKEASQKLLEFQSALALQCFTNEYVSSHTEEEEKILKSLEASVRKDLENNEQPSPQMILALASYKALNQYDWCKY